MTTRRRPASVTVTAPGPFRTRISRRFTAGHAFAGVLAFAVVLGGELLAVVALHWAGWFAVTAGLAVAAFAAGRLTAGKVRTVARYRPPAGPVRPVEDAEASSRAKSMTSDRGKSVLAPRAPIVATIESLSDLCMGGECERCDKKWCTHNCAHPLRQQAAPLVERTESEFGYQTHINERHPQ